MSIGERLRARGLRPKKSYGQNFLTDVHAAKTIARAATDPAGGTVLEVGPGLGALTRWLVERAARVVAVEKDAELVPLLREELADHVSTLEIVVGDALEADWAALLAAGPRPHTIAGNVPYLVTGRLVERAIGCADDVDRVVFMVQAEVADRLVAAPGSEAYGALTVFTQAAFSVKRVLTVKAGAFVPRPEVDSAVVAFTPLRPRRAAETPAFRAAVKAAFGQRRKTLRNAWKHLYDWTPAELEAHAAAAEIDLKARGETLSVDDFARLAARAAHRPAP